MVDMLDSGGATDPGEAGSIQPAASEVLSRIFPEPGLSSPVHRVNVLKTRRELARAIFTTEDIELFMKHLAGRDVPRRQAALAVLPGLISNKTLDVSVLSNSYLKALNGLDIDSSDFPKQFRVLIYAGRKIAPRFTPRARLKLTIGMIDELEAVAGRIHLSSEMISAQVQDLRSGYIELLPRGIQGWRQYIKDLHQEGATPEEIVEKLRNLERELSADDILQIINPCKPSGISRPIATPPVKKDPRPVRLPKAASPSVKTQPAVVEATQPIEATTVLQGLFSQESLRSLAESSSYRQNIAIARRELSRATVNSDGIEFLIGQATSPDALRRRIAIDVSPVLVEIMLRNMSVNDLLSVSDAYIGVVGRLNINSFTDADQILALLQLGSCVAPIIIPGGGGLVLNIIDTLDKLDSRVRTSNHRLSGQITNRILETRNIYTRLLNANEGWYMEYLDRILDDDLTIEEITERLFRLDYHTDGLFRIREDMNQLRARRNK